MLKQRLTAAERKTQILEKSGRIFAKKGFNGATTREIAASCRISEGVIYQHFKSKDELFHAALESKISEHNIEGFLAELPADLPLQDVFERIATRVLDIGLRDPIVHKLLLTATLAGPPRTKAAYVNWRLPFVEYLRAVIERGVECGEIRRVDPLLTARAFVGMIMDCVLSCNLWIEMGEPTFEPETLVQNNVPTFVRGLMQTDGAERSPDSPTNKGEKS